MSEEKKCGVLSVCAELASDTSVSEGEEVMLDLKREISQIMERYKSKGIIKDYTIKKI